MRSAFLTIFALLLAAACGDDGGVSSGPDASVSGVDAAGEPDAGPPTSTAFVVGTDYMTSGIASTVSVPGLELVENAIAGVASTDPVVRYFDGLVFIINRFGADNITIVDASDLSLVDQFSTGADSNPQDIAVVGSKYYVASLAGAGVDVYDSADTGSGPTATIDLSALDSVDGIPNCHALATSGTNLFVICGVLDDNDGFLTPRGPGVVAVIDTGSDMMSTSFELTNNRPFGHVLVSPSAGPLGGDILVPTVPDFFSPTTGCVERIDVATPSAAGCFVSNTDLGGYASGLVYGEGNTIHIAVTEGFDEMDFGPIGAVRPVMATTGAVGELPMTPPGQRPFAIAACPTGELVLLDAAGGVRVYDGDTELTTEVIDIGLPPVSQGVACY